jgi:hypothetical protein
MRMIASAAVILIMIAVSEVLNVMLLTAIYGQTRGAELFSSEDGFIQAFATTPTNVFFALFILILYFIFKAFDKRKGKNGETGAKTGR